MTTKTFQAACVALWGPQYRSPGARELGIALSTMNRYQTGQREVPTVLMDRLYGLLHKRHSEIGKLLVKVRGGREISA